eukprot:scaffold13984_cov128-Skeletonema_dohrnii-CCMP3373.AAC.4
MQQLRRPMMAVAAAATTLLLLCSSSSSSSLVDGFVLPTHATTRLAHHRSRGFQPTHQLHSSAAANDDDNDDVSEAAALTTVDPKAKAEIRNILNHLSTQTLESLLSSSDAKLIYEELFFSSSDDDDEQSSIFNDETYQQYIKYWDKLGRKLREETRTPADLLGTDITNRILSFIRGDGDGSSSSSGSYDAQTVKTFLESDAINSLFTQLLYDAIFEFTTSIDIIGNAISKLPLLGPVRNQVLKESKRNMDRTLGPLLRQFLSGYTRVAIRQAVDFVVSKENASKFASANAKLVGYLLKERSVSAWIPEDKVLAEWRQDVWDYLVGLERGSDNQKIINQSIDWVYDLVGDKCIDDAGVNVGSIIDSSPTLEKNAALFWKRCQDNAN